MASQQIGTQDDLIAVGPWPKGMITAIPGKAIPEDALLDAKNVDIDAAGGLRLRDGYAKVIPSLNGSHSIFSDEASLYFVDGQSLMRATPAGDGFQVSSIASGLRPGVPVHWERQASTVWWSNGDQHGRIVSGQALPFGVETPSVPTLAAGGLGGLSAGRYAVSICFALASGEEGGATERQFVELAEGQRVEISGISSPVNSMASRVIVYLSEANGSTLYKALNLPAGVSSAVISSGSAKGRAQRNELMEEFPACHNLQLFGGWMLGSAANYLLHSNPFQFGLYDPARNFIPFAAEIDLVVAMDDGFYVCADQTYWISGASPDEWQPRVVLPYGATPGTLSRSDTEPKAFWWSDKGQIIAGNSGQLSNVSVGNLAAKLFAKGASINRRSNGIDQIVNTFPSGIVSSMGIKETMEAELIRAANH